MDAEKLERKLEHDKKLEDKKRYKELKEQEEEYEDLPADVFNKLYR